MPAPVGAALGAVSAYGSQNGWLPWGYLRWLIIENPQMVEECLG